MDIRVFSVAALRSDFIKHELPLSLVIFYSLHKLFPLLVVVNDLLLIESQWSSRTISKWVHQSRMWSTWNEALCGRAWDELLWWRACGAENSLRSHSRLRVVSKNFDGGACTNSCEPIWRDPFLLLRVGSSRRLHYISDLGGFFHLLSDQLKLLRCHNLLIILKADVVFIDSWRWYLWFVEPWAYGFLW